MIWRRRSNKSIFNLIDFSAFLFKKRLNKFYLEKRERLDKVRVFHRKNCELLPEKPGRIGLGDTEDLQEVYLKAKMIYPKVEGCKYCVAKEVPESMDKI